MTKSAATNSRTKNSTVNLLTGFLSQFVILVLNFVVRYIFVHNIGYEYLGVNSLFSSILTVLSVADLGFGSALGIVLYSSLAKKNEEEIAGLMNFFKKVYLVIGLIVTAVGLIITPFVKYLTNTTSEVPYLSVYFLFFLANTVSSYFISYRTILIRADQKNSVVNNVTTLVKIGKAILEAFVLFLFPKWFGLMATYIAYLVIMVVATYAIGIITAIYANKKYPYAFNNKIAVDPNKKKEIITTTKDLFVYRLCSAFSSPIDSILISLFVGTLILGVYSNYTLILTTLIEFICLISRNTISSVGNFVVEKSLEHQKKLYFEIQTIYFAIIVFCTINFVSLVSPFINLVFKPENSLSQWVVFLLGLTLIFRCIGELNIIFRETTKIYKRTKYISLFNTVIHIGLSALLGYFYGLNGILLGNVIAYLVTNFWFELFALFKWYFKESPAKVYLQFLYVILITIGCSVGGYFLCGFIASHGVIFFILSCFLSLVFSFIGLAALYPLEGFDSLFNRLKRIFTAFLSKIKTLLYKRKVQICIFIAYFAFVFVYTALTNFLGINVNKYIFIFIFALALLLLTRGKAIAVMLFTLPLSPSVGETFFVTISLVYLFFITFKKHRFREWMWMLAIPLSLFILEIILSATYGSVSIQETFRMFELLFLLAIVFYDKDIFTKKHLYAFVFGCLFMLMVVGTNWILGFVWAMRNKGTCTWFGLSIFLKDVRLGVNTYQWASANSGIAVPINTSIQFSDNSNNLALFSIVSMVSVYAVLGSARLKERAFSIVLFALFAVFGVWTQSRMFVIALALFILLSPLFSAITKRKDWISSIALLSFVISVVFLVLLVFPDIRKALLSRFMSGDISSGGSRFEIIREYLTFIFSNWKYATFGVSVSNLYPLSGLEQMPHTNFLQLLCGYGMIVFAGFVVFLVFSFKKTKQKTKFNSQMILLYAPLLFTVIFTFSLQLLMPTVILIAFIPSMICCSYLNKGAEKSIKFYSIRKVDVNENERIKMAVFATSFGGGIGTYIYNMCALLPKDNYEIHLITNYDTTPAELEKFNGLNLFIHLSSFAKKKNKLAHLFKKYNTYLDILDSVNPAIIYINAESYSRSSVIVSACSTFKASRVVYHAHSNKRPSPFEKGVRFMLDSCFDYRFACSKESGINHFGKSFVNPKIKNCFVIKNSIDCDRFAYNNNFRKDIRTKYNLTKSDIVLGTVGRLSEEKNQLFIVDVLSTLPSNYKMLIVGDGPLKEQLENKVYELEINDRVILVGQTKEPEKFYSAFDIFCLPSLTEGLPFSSIEAQCSGCVNVVSKDLTDELIVTPNVVYLPLEPLEWNRKLLKIKPISILERTKCASFVKEAGYSNESSINFVCDTLLKLVNEVK